MLKETAALIFSIEDFWDITVCSPAGDYHCFGGNCCLHSQGRRLLLGYDSSLEGGNPADGGRQFLRHGNCPPGYTVP